jgi:hypothetical protein
MAHEVIYILLSPLMEILSSQIPMVSDMGSEQGLGLGLD